MSNKEKPDEKPGPTAPPPFDPDGYARESEVSIQAAMQAGATTTAGGIASPYAASVRSSVSALRVTSEDNESLPKIPVIALSEDERTWILLEEAADAVLTLIDGVRTVAEVLAAAGLEPPTGLAIFSRLRAQGVVKLLEP